MIGVQFQPGGGSGSGDRPKTETDGVQEAIKVLSLRLPKVVGAQGISPQALLSGTGAAGSRVDSVVNQVLAKMFPQGGMAPMQTESFGMAPNAPQGAPSFGGTLSANPLMQMQRQAPDTSNGLSPRVTVDIPQYAPPMYPFTGTTPNDRPIATPDGGFSPFPGMVDQLPKNLQFPTFHQQPSYEAPARDREPLI